MEIGVITILLQQLQRKKLGHFQHVALSCCKQNKQLGMSNWFPVLGQIRGSNLFWLCSNLHPWLKFYQQLWLWVKLCDSAGIWVPVQTWILYCTFTGRRLRNYFTVHSTCNDTMALAVNIFFKNNAVLKLCSCFHNWSSYFREIKQQSVWLIKTALVSCWSNAAQLCSLPHQDTV